MASEETLGSNSSGSESNPPEDQKKTKAYLRWLNRPYLKTYRRSPKVNRTTDTRLGSSSLNPESDHSLETNHPCILMF